jgi:acetyltransferase-like isoleucine patch superfamily enzyme
MIIIGNNCRINGELICKQEGRLTIGNYTTIQDYCSIRCCKEIRIGSYCGIAEGSVIMDNNSHSTEIHNWIEHRIRVAPGGKGYPGLGNGWELSMNASIFIGDGVWIGENVTILKGVGIGDGAIVGRSSVVTKSVDPFTIVAGNPARKVKDLRIPSKSIDDIACEIKSNDITL